MTTAQDSLPRRLLRAPHRVADVLAGVVLIGITVVALANVGSRAIAGQPIASANELIGSCLMVALVYLPLSSSRHVRITALTIRLPRAVRRWLNLVVTVLCLGGLLLAVWATLLAAVVSFQSDESTVGLHTFPLGPVRLVICIGIALLCLRVISDPAGWLDETPGQEPHPDGSTHLGAADAAVPTDKEAGR